MNRSTAIIIVALIGLAAPLQSVRAQTPATVTGSYVAGWNMAAGPSGTDFSTASALDAYGSTGYVPVVPQTASGCQGYWALFARPAAIPLSMAQGPTQSCSLAAGWNLIGNPFSGVAVIPAGITAYHWNTDKGAYDVVSQLQPGTSVWIYSPTASGVTLGFLSTSTTPPATLVIDSPVLTGPYTIHVGDSVELLAPNASPIWASADPSYLHLEVYGETGDISCTGDPSCAGELTTQIWIWHAIAAGTTQIALSPFCVGTLTPCPTTSAIKITILA